MVYTELLADVPVAELTLAIRELVITGDRFRPSVGEIRRKVVERRMVIPSDEHAMAGCERLDAWDDACQVPRGSGPERVAPPDVHPSIRAAWDSVGPHALPAVFVRAWREERERLMVRLTGESLRVGPELGATREIEGRRG